MNVPTNNTPSKSWLARALVPDFWADLPFVFSDRTMQLRDESLYGVNPFDPKLPDDVKAKICDECRINVRYFRSIALATKNADREGYGITPPTGWSDIGFIDFTEYVKILGMNDSVAEISIPPGMVMTENAAGIGVVVPATFSNVDSMTEIEEEKAEISYDASASLPKPKTPHFFGRSQHAFDIDKLIDVTLQEDLLDRMKLGAFDGTPRPLMVPDSVNRMLAERLPDVERQIGLASRVIGPTISDRFLDPVYTKEVLKRAVERRREKVPHPLAFGNFGVTDDGVLTAQVKIPAALQGVKPAISIRDTYSGKPFVVKPKFVHITSTYKKRPGKYAKRIGTRQPLGYALFAGSKLFVNTK